MKKIILFLLLISANTFSQNRYSTVTTSSYTPISYEELSYVANQKRSQYNQNQNYLYSLKDWIRKLSSQVTEETYRGYLQTVYNQLVEIENEDLARYSTYLKQVEDVVKEIINSYNDFMKNNQGNYTSNNHWITHPLIVKAKDQLSSKDYASAISNYSKYLEIDKNNTDVLYMRALTKAYYGDKEGAINDYNKIIELNSNYPIQIRKLEEVYLSKIDCLIALERWKEALTVADKALEFYKKMVSLWEIRGGIYYKLSNYEKSIQDLNTAIKIEESSFSYYYRGLSYSKLGKKNNACKDLKKAEKLGLKVDKNEFEEACK